MSKNMNENMKKEGLTFLEAVKDMENGLCKEIQNEDNISFSINKDGTLSYLGIKNDNHDSGIRLKPTSFLSKKWKLIGKIRQRFVIEDVAWKQKNGYIFPCINSKNPLWHRLCRKPKMKMILEWEE